MHGGWATDKFTIETDVWQDFSLSITGDNHINVGMSGHAQDNVTQFERDLASVIGNLFALCPITGGLILGFDKAIFEGLKAERDALEEAGKFQIVRDEKVGGSDADDDYTFPLTEASFDEAQGRLVINIVTKQSNISRSHACKIRQNLTNQQTQGEKLKTAQNYTVKPHDSAWSIAKEMYGEGKYYWFVAGLNNLTPSGVNQLRPGQVLRLESLGSFLRAGGHVMVVRRDSFWTISRDQKSTARVKYFDLLNANRTRFPSPDTIFPLQVIDYPKKP
jgi:nucleoid-associated protein YgaU